MPRNIPKPIKDIRYKEPPRTIPFSLRDLNQNMQEFFNYYLEYSLEYGFKSDLTEKSYIEEQTTEEKLDQDIWEQLIKEEK